MKRFSALLLTCALAVALGLNAFAQGKRGTGAKGGVAAKPAAMSMLNVPVVSQDEMHKMIAQSAAKGRPVLVNFWATWCGPCREEMPEFVQLNKQYGDKLDFLIVSLDDDANDIKTEVPSFLSQVKVTMPAVVAHFDSQENFMNSVDEAWSGTLPATFIYGADGKIVYKRLARINLEELKPAIEGIVKK